MDISQRLNLAIEQFNLLKEKKEKGLLIHELASRFDLDKSFLATEMSKRSAKKRAAMKDPLVFVPVKKPRLVRVLVRRPPPEHWLDRFERNQE